MPDFKQTGGVVQEPVIAEPLSKELSRHKGRWVAILGERVVAVSNSAVQVRDEALSNGVTDPVLFRVPLHPIRLSFF